MDAAAFLQDEDAPRQPVYAVSGKEDFFRRRCREAIVRRTLGEADPEFAVAAVAGDQLTMPQLKGELSTLPFLAPMRIVIVEQADEFITKNRDGLEKYVAVPSAVGVLILEPDSFPSNTKLAKALPAGAKIECAPLNPYKPAEAEGWCRSWAKSHHKKKLAADAAALLVERVGMSLGLLDQELGKLAVAVGSKTEIEPEHVEQFVGRSRAGNVFRILDAVGEGKPQEAFAVLGELFEEGEEPLAILGAMTSQLRKLAGIGRLVAFGQALGPAMDAAGVSKWPAARQAVERQLKHLGRNRLAKLADQLVDINLGLKGGSPLAPRLQLERLLAELAKPR